MRALNYSGKSERWAPPLVGWHNYHIIVFENKLRTLSTNMTRATKIFLAIFATLVSVSAADISSEDGGVCKASQSIGKSTKAAPMSYSNILPFSLPRKCIDADEGLNEETMLLDQDVFIDCNAGDVGQDWILHQEGNIVQWESALHPGYCIATEHDHNVVDELGSEHVLIHAQISKLEVWRGASYGAER